MKKKNNETVSAGDVKRHMGVLEEHFNDGVKLVAEQYLDIKKTLDSHTEKLDSHTEMIGQLMVDTNEIKNNLKRKVDFEDFARLEKRVVILETRVMR